MREPDQNNKELYAILYLYPEAYDEEIRKSYHQYQAPQYENLQAIDALFLEDQTGNSARTCSVTEQSPPGLIYGGTYEIKGAVKSLKYLELSKFAVDDHKKQQNKLLEFVKIVKVKGQVVAGRSYYITSEQTDGRHKKIYEAIIWEKPWMNFRVLIGFELIDDA